MSKDRVLYLNRPLAPHFRNTRSFVAYPHKIADLAPRLFSNTYAAHLAPVSTQYPWREV